MSKLTMKLSYGPQMAFQGQSFENLTEAQIVFAQERDDSCRGASGWGDAKVFKNGKQIAMISYNARAWTNDGKTLIAEYPYEKQSID